MPKKLITFMGKPDAGNPAVRFDEWRGGISVVH